MLGLLYIRRRFSLPFVSAVIFAVRESESLVLIYTKLLARQVSGECGACFQSAGGGVCEREMRESERRAFYIMD